MEPSADQSQGFRISPGSNSDPKCDRSNPALGKLSRELGWRGVMVLAGHEAAWISRWRCSDVEVDGDADAQLALRFALYHLNSAANPADESVSIGARAYAWESADTGAEMTPEQVIGPDHRVVDVLCGKQEQHISADVAYAVWQYWQATEDESFLLDAGAEILIETAQFWSSRAFREADGRCHIRGIIGPDENHEHINDNAYKNVMARWNIHRALDVVALLRTRWPARWASFASCLGLEDGELQESLHVAETMATGLDPATGLFEQLTGYFAPEDIDLANYAGRTVPVDVVLGRERTQKSQVAKQADVVALLSLLPQEFVGDTKSANFATTNRAAATAVP